MTFLDSKAVSGYVENATRRVPGLHDVHRMAAVLLAESTGSNGRVLIVGAGGGMELSLFAQLNPDWQFDGVDPSAEMLNLARASIGDLSPRVRLHEGYVQAAPKGPFDAASCLLTLHFITEDERYQTLKEIHARLKPGGIFVSMHYSLPADPKERDLWMSRCGAFAILYGVDPEQATASMKAITEQLPILTPEQDEDLMRRAGFSNIRTFYMGFAFRGWVAEA